MKPSPHRPVCSVIIATYNRPAQLAVTLADLWKQAIEPDEVIVVEQSTDAEGRPLDQSAQLHHPRLRYFSGHPANAQRARNFALGEARGDIVIMLDDDMRLSEGFVAAHLKNYEDPDIDGVAGQVLKPGQQPVDELPAVCRQRSLGWLRFPLHYAHRTRCVNWPSCNGSVKRALAMEVGGFDEQFTRTLYDDTDFSHRLALAGAKVIFDPAASAVHLKVPSGGRRPSALNFLVLADADNWATVFYFWRKNFGLWPVRGQVLRKLREVFARTVFLRQPAQLAAAWREMVAGWHTASRKLAEGPRYGWPVAGR